MKFYAIRHNPSGLFLPSLDGSRNKRSRGGYTHTEPTPLEPPRLFTNLRAARNALTCWLSGVISQKWSYDPDSGYYDDLDLETSPRPDRKREEMEIVPIYIRVRKS